MKKSCFGIVGLLGVSLLASGTVFAQGMMGYWNAPPLDNTAIQAQQQEEQEGKQLLDSLNTQTVTCAQLTDSDFEKIGEYFMGLSIGDTQRHIAMNEMMQRMMGEQGEEQMHTLMGKRMSGCDASATYTPQANGYPPMMGGMMWGYRPSLFGYNGYVPYGGSGFCR